MRFIISLFLFLSSLPAFASGGEGGGHTDPVAIVALGLALLLVAARLGGRLFEKFGQPAVLGELLAGVVLGNLALTGWDGLEFLRQDPRIDAFARLGAIFLLFQAGLESNLKKMMEVGVTAFNVAVVGVVAPMVLGYGASWLLVDNVPWTTHLFAGATLSATSVGITAAVFKEFRAVQSAEGRIVLGAAVIDDVLGLLVLAVVAGIIQTGHVSIEAILIISTKAVAFLGVALLIGERVAPLMARLTSKFGHQAKVLTLIVFALGMSWAAAAIGLAAIVGAFAAGLVLDETHFEDHGHKHSAEELMEPISHFLVPVFFVMMGFQVRLETFTNMEVLGVALGLTAAAIIGKQVCGLPFKGGTADRLTVGLGMIPRGEVGLIFAAIGRELGVVNHGLYSAIVIMVIATTMVTPPLLGWRLRQLAAKA